MEIAVPAKTSFLEEFKRLLPERKVLLAWLVVIVAFVWFHWSSFCHLTRTWWQEEDYQHGFFVPLFALVLLWLRRDMIVQSPGHGSWWGLPFFGLWALMRWVAIYFNYENLPEMSLIPCVAGVVVFVGGWRALRWAWPSVVFLIFMLPLPGFVQGFASRQLQQAATTFSCYIIQTLGIPAVAQGIVIQLTEKPLEIARACSGLRMMMLFFAICVAAAFLATHKPLWERLLIVASAPPIAVLSNVLRIVVTAAVYDIVGRWSSTIDVDRVEQIIHDWAGFLMMPVGLLLLWAEMSLLSKLLIAPPPARPLMIGEVLAGQSTEVATERVLEGRQR